MCTYQVKKLQVQCLAFQLKICHHSIASLPRIALVKISWPTFVISPRKVHSSSQLIRSVMFGFPAKVSWPNIVSLPRKASSQPIPIEVSDSPTAVVFSRHWGGA